MEGVSRQAADSHLARGSLVNKDANDSREALLIRTDAEVEEMEQNRWRQLVQQSWFHSNTHLHRWSEDALIRGSSYRSHTVAARTTVWPSTTAAVVLSLNLDPTLWLDEGGINNKEGPGASFSAPRVYGWRLPALLPSNSVNILGELGQQLEKEYQSLSKRSLMVSHCHNSRGQDFARYLSQSRHFAGQHGKVILHYGGYDVPRPSDDWLYHRTPGVEVAKYSIDSLRSHVGFPLVMIADCAGAASILCRLLDGRQKEDSQLFAYRPYGASLGVHNLMDSDRSNVVMSSWRSTDVASPASGGTTLSAATVVPNTEGVPPVAATGGDSLSGFRGLVPSSASFASASLRDDFFFLGATTHEALTLHPQLPSDIFTSCLVTPVRMAVLWFLVENSQMIDVHPLLLSLIPGALEDKKTPLGQLQWAFMSITECIAWSTLPHSLFAHIFREDVVVAPLFRGFLLAERIISALGGQVSVYPSLPRTSDHIMWDTLDNIIDRTLVSVKRAFLPTPRPALSRLGFREWLDWNVAKWRYEQRSLPLPTLNGRRVVVPDFIKEDLRCLLAVAQRVTEQSFPLSFDTNAQPQWAGHTGQRASVLGPRNTNEEVTNPHGFPHRTRAIAPGANGDGVTGLYGRRTDPTHFPFIMRLPALLQGLLVLTHRDEATKVMCRLVDAGPPAVAVCAEVGIFSMALVHFWSRHDLRCLLPALLFIYAKACYTDPLLAGTSSAQRDVVLSVCLEVLKNPVTPHTEPGPVTGAWQGDVLGCWAGVEGQRSLAAAVICMLCFSFAEDRERYRKLGALRVCCELLRDIAGKLPLLLHEPSRLEKRADAERCREGAPSCGVAHAEMPTYATAQATMYVPCLIALLVSLSWETSLCPPAPSGAAPGHIGGFQDKGIGGSSQSLRDSDAGKNPGDNSVQSELTSSLEALWLLSWSSSALVRGASLKALTVIMISKLSNDDTALQCVRIIANFTESQTLPREGNTDNRLQFVGALFLSIQYLTERLTSLMSIEEMRKAVYLGLKGLRRSTSGPHELRDGCDMREAKRADTLDSSFCTAYSSAGVYTSTYTPRSTEDGGGGCDVSCMLDLLVRLTWQLAVVNHDPCPYVSAYARKVSVEDLSQLQVHNLPLFCSTNATVDAMECAANTSHNVSVTSCFPNMLGSFILRGGKQRTHCAPTRTVEHRLRGIGGGDYEDSGMDSVEASGGGRGIGRGCGVGGSSGGAATAGAGLSLRTVSLDDNSTVSSFIYTLLSFLGELLLVPMDDEDLRHPLNLDRKAHLRRYLRTFRKHMHLSLPSDPCRVEECGAMDASPLPSVSISPLPSSSFIHASLPDSEVKGRASVVSQSTSSFFSSDVPPPPDVNNDAAYGLVSDADTLMGRFGRIQVLTFHPTGRHLVAGTDQGVIQIWALGKSGADGQTSAGNAGPTLGTYSPQLAPLTTVSSVGASAGAGQSLSSSVRGANTAFKLCALHAHFCVYNVVARASSNNWTSDAMSFTHSQHSRAAYSAAASGANGKGYRHLVASTVTSAAAALSNAALEQHGHGRSISRGDSDVSSGGSGRCARCAEPLAGLHLVDAAYRTLLCVVGRSGTVQLFSDYTSASTVRRVTSFVTMRHEDSLSSHQCLSSYHSPSMRLHMSSAHGTIASWDLSYEHKVSEGIGHHELQTPPSVLASNPNDLSTLGVGAGSVYLFDLRDASQRARVLLSPEALANSLPGRERVLGNYEPFCLHVGFSCRYAHGIVTAYGGEQGAVMLWDDRNLRFPVLQNAVVDPAYNSPSSLSSVCYVDVQHYSEALTTMSVTSRRLFIADFVRASAAKYRKRELEGAKLPTQQLSASLKEHPTAACLHPVLPLCAVVSGGSIQIYGRRRALDSD
ncbi:Raptor N terminal CASPase like domain [Trypanosoma vivax]|uniref:Raptor N-terminal CASPase-like domain-containing protein n=1 Tax=Trypanosoma vivax (strain Y486) TaxID=1055687 RepID=G0TR93_TRYVY|nr:Raptor N terminal CASPase like domain [Trypanosoma vivax]CCC46457.1 conserved hypothetical protein [Trypanosoma vivax Y486]